MYVNKDQFAEVFSTCCVRQLQQVLNTLLVRPLALYFLNMRSRQCLHVEMKTFEFFVAVVETTLGKVEKQTSNMPSRRNLPASYILPLDRILSIH